MRANRRWASRALLAVGTAATAVAASCTAAPVPNTLLTPGHTLEPTPAAVDRPWPMHLIDGRFRGSNALGPGDVNHDGLTDAVTNYEFDQRYVIELHPPAGSDPRTAWQTVDLKTNSSYPGHGSDTENAALADLDGDGNLDVIGTQGGHITPFWEGFEPGVRVIWSPGPGGDVTDAAQWTDAGRFPASLSTGHMLWVQARDLNGDGATDLVLGGRQMFFGGPYSSIHWLEAPADPAQRRDLARWVRHDIDPTAHSGHGFQWGDIDGDGNPDLVNVNADFDTEDADESVTWYRNPGPAAAATSGPWVAHEVDRDPAFDVKPGLAMADLDRDGRVDIITQTAKDVYWYRADPAAPSGFTKVVIPKPPETQQFSRPVRVADMNGDGRPDLVGGLVHTDGTLDEAKFSVFWMEYSGAAPAAGNWTTHVIRHGNGRPMLIGAFGEKWDMMSLIDVDGDGDLDVVANSEEWWVNDGLEVTAFDAVRHSESQAVVWFENTLGDAPPHHPGAGAAPLVLEAEAPTLLGGGALVPRSQFGPGRCAGFSGTGYLQAFRALDTTFDPGATSAERSAGAVSADRPGGVRYDITLGEAGPRDLWVRRLVPATFGYSGGGAAADSAWASIDGGAWAALDQQPRPTDTWVWVKVAPAVPLAAGNHQLALKLREPGYAIDQVVLAPVGWAPPSGAA